ncbi:MAG: 4'-phosphopantetheinyl transferase superfamily protein [Bacteroides sp.]|nr:4'-phosphopantetheinyl transferase superfamily protein [Bacteroides sp.]MCM1380082.1 4'-phosphopantetheinyl transferase superfamily protein [Bacteroides sp.]MCM1446419.1 4'-phosphopantetheinyl transferase superfamily protein [Prevotella sp.]
MMEVHIAEGGRRAVEKLVAEQVGPEIRIIHVADGAPLLVGSPLHISISHSRNFAAIALDEDVRIGIDIEEPRLEQLRRVISKFLLPEELPTWESQLLRAWTAKEATFKAAAVAGLTIGRICLSEADVAKVPDGRSFLLDFTETAQYTVATATPLTAEAIYQRGKRRMKAGNRPGALSDFNRAAALDPAGPGAAAAQHLTNIFNFFNPDIYNP